MPRDDILTALGESQPGAAPGAAAEIIVRTDRGETLSVVQGEANRLVPGERVLIVPGSPTRLLPVAGTPPPS